jgi:hypothetical protein
MVFRFTDRVMLTVSHFSELTNDAIIPGNAYCVMFISGFVKDLMREDQKLEGKSRFFSSLSNGTSH